MKQCPLNSQDIIYNILAMEREVGKVMKDNNINLLLVIAHLDDEIISAGILIRCFQSMNAIVFLWNMVMVCVKNTRGWK